MVLVLISVFILSRHETSPLTANNSNFHEGGSAIKAEFSCVQPIKPHTRCFTDQLKAFHLTENWPYEKIRATPFEIADAGFYYLGNKDKVKCWYCDGGLQNWEGFDLPWEEHAKFFPKCEFLLKSKGLEVVKNFVKKFPKLNRPSLLNPAAIGIVDDHVFLKPVPVPIAKKLILPPFIDPRKNTEREEKIQKEMLNGKNVEMARIFGFQEEKIRHVLEQRLDMSLNRERR